ncbi:MAG: baseplate J/gp47 family protein, partial [Paenibacillus macerans]|nr:baseplate J/gp47 family protein [Paenibacillus macerans]
MVLTDLPDIEFISVDASETQNNIISIYEALAGRTLYPGDPVRLFLTALAQIIVQQRVAINYSAKQNLLRYAAGGILDNIGARSNVTRLPATPARTTLSFQLSASLTSAVNIPAGIRVGLNDGSDLYFATTEVLEIPAGSTTGTVTAECTTAGAIGNGFTIGQINVIIDPLPFVQSASNTTVTEGGADEETDDAYRERIHIAPESFSVAGPDG